MLNKLLLALVVCLSINSDLLSQTWNQKANMPALARHRSTAFSIGNKGYVCLGHVNTISNILFKDLWEYNPASNTWTQKADFGGGDRYHCHGFVIDGKAYVGTGRDASNSQDDNWEYDPVVNVWTAKADIPGPARRGTVSFTINGLGYVGSGSAGGGGSNSFYSYDPTLDSWDQVSSFPGPARSSAVGFSIGDNGYMGTGRVSGTGSNDFWEYNSILDVWTQKANVGDSLRHQASGFSLNNVGYIGTGHNDNIDDDMDDFWQYMPLTDTWVEVEEFLGVSRRYMVSFVIAGKAFTSGGTNGINFNDLWEYNPNYIVAMPQFDFLTVEFVQKQNGNFEVNLENLPSVNSGLSMLVTSPTGQVVESIPISAHSFEIPSSQYPAYCIYRLVQDGKPVKTGKLRASTIATSVNQ